MHAWKTVNLPTTAAALPCLRIHHVVHRVITNLKYITCICVCASVIKFLYGQCSRFITTMERCPPGFKKKKKKSRTFFLLHVFNLIQIPFMETRIHCWWKNEGKPSQRQKTYLQSRQHRECEPDSCGPAPYGWLKA